MNYVDDNFRRNTPARRSAGHSDKCIEYFVPRSLSEFNLSGVVGELYDLSSFTDKPKNDNKVSQKTRDKMVTFEDDRPPGPVLNDDVFM